MKANWPKVRLGEVLRQIERPEAVDATKAYRLLGVRWYGQGLFVREEKIGADIAANRVYSVRLGDFVYNRLFAWKGSFAVAGPEVDGAYVSNEFPCFSTMATRLHPYFLFWYFRRERAWSEVLGLSTGATPTSRNRLKESEFLAMEVPLPSLAEQRRVVSRIEELAAQIHEVGALRRGAAEAVRALLASARRTLVGDSPRADWIPVSQVVSEIENGKSPRYDSRPAHGDEWGVLKVGAVSFGSFDERQNKAVPAGHRLELRPHGGGRPISERRWRPRPVPSRALAPPRSRDLAIADRPELPSQLEQARDGARALPLTPAFVHRLAHQICQQRALVGAGECLVEGRPHVVGNAEVHGGHLRFPRTVEIFNIVRPRPPTVNRRTLGLQRRRMPVHVTRSGWPGRSRPAPRRL